MTIRLETKFGKDLLENLHQWIILMVKFGDIEFTKREYDNFLKKYSLFQPKETETRNNCKENFINAPKMSTLTTLLNNNLIRVARTEKIGYHGKNFYEVNYTYFEKILKDIQEIQGSLLYGEDDECVKQGVKIVEYLNKTIAND